MKAGIETKKKMVTFLYNEIIAVSLFDYPNNAHESSLK